MRKSKLFIVGLLALSLPVVTSLAGCNVSFGGQESSQVETSLVIASLPNKTKYKPGDSYSSEGLRISDINGNEITDYEVDIADGTVLNNVGTFTNTIRKRGYKSTSFVITVESENSLVVSNMPNKTRYNRGEAFDSTGLVIVDSSSNVITDFQLSIKNGQVLNQLGENRVDVTCEGYQSTFFYIIVNDQNGGSGGNTSSIPTGERTIKFEYVNDTHGAFSNADDGSQVGMTYLSPYLMEQKSSGNAVILSGGDMFQGGVESNCTYGQIMVEAMNITGFDAMVVGNHEFDWGEQKLSEMSDTANFPFLSCNIFYSNTNNERPKWLTPYTIIERNDLRIGIIGFARENMGSSILTSIASSFSFPEPNQYVKSYSTLLRKEFNCNLIIAAGHDEGYDASNGKEPTKLKDLTDKDPNTNLPYIDGLFLAHDHYKKSGKMNGVPFLEAGNYSKYIGEMTFTFNNSNGNFSLANSTYNVYTSSYYCKTANQEIVALLEKYKDVIINADTVIYNFKHSYSRDEFVVVVCKAISWVISSNPNVFQNQSVSYVTHNIAGIKKGVSAGEFTYGDLEAVCPHDNAITIQKVTQTQLNYWLNNSSVAYYQTGYTSSDRLTNIGTISYVAENYGTGHQESYVEYDEFTSKTALFKFLNEKVDSTL